MKRYISAVLVFILPFSAYAGVTADVHIQGALAFAHKKIWEAALQEANAAHSPVLAKYIVWEYLRDPGSDATFENITGFLKNNSDWPDQPLLLKHAEVALLAGNPTDATLTRWFKDHPPRTNLARLKEAHSKQELDTLIRDAWINDDYDKDTEARLIAKYHSLFRTEDHVLRIDRLLWEGKDDEAKRLLKYVPENYQHLFQARMALAEDKSDAPSEVARVQAGFNDNPGLMYERLRWRVRRGDKDGAREILLNSPLEVPYPEKWWPIRDRQIREALGEGDVKLALGMLARHAQLPDSLSYKEAQWLEGWIALEFSNHPDKAYTIFTGLAKDVHTPGGKSRVDYWAGRAALGIGKSGNASKWFDDAARYPTTFYGQLAAWEADPHAVISVRTEIEPSAAQKEHFRRRELVQLVYLLNSAHETDAAGRFIFYLVDDAESPEDIILATRLGHEIDRVDYSVRAAKKALQSDIVSLASGWPLIRFSATQGVEKPLLLALSRQESEFFADAVSSSGALGLMQLLPGTAKEIARKNDMPYSAERLFNPDYNMAVGSLYLRKMLDHFNGSYVLAIASYNAGPGRVAEWLGAYGNPGQNVHQALDWVERIPTNETRNYVQHVLENVQIYRYILADKPVRITLADDLLR